MTWTWLNIIKHENWTYTFFCQVVIHYLIFHVIFQSFSNFLLLRDIYPHHLHSTDITKPELIKAWTILTSWASFLDRVRWPSPNSQGIKVYFRSETGPPVTVLKSIWPVTSESCYPTILHTSNPGREGCLWDPTSTENMIKIELSKGQPSPHELVFGIEFGLTEM